MTIFDADVVGLQNVHTPLSSSQHLGFCIIATVIYLIQFYRHGGWHNLLLLLAIDLTYITQTSLCSEENDYLLLGIAEVVLLAASFTMQILFNKKQKSAKLAAEAAADEQNERRTAAENEQKAQDEKFVDNAFEE